MAAPDGLRLPPSPTGNISEVTPVHSNYYHYKGGGIYNEGTATISDSTISGNTAGKGRHHISWHRDDLRLQHLGQYHRTPPLYYIHSN